MKSFKTDYKYLANKNNIWLILGMIISGLLAFMVAGAMWWVI